jgi:UDP-N-acetylglucosamine 2-epimerase (non-hydrolysing)
MDKSHKKILLVLGTRPEAIKMCPLIKELKKWDIFNVKVCVSGQHREMLEQVLHTFEVLPDYDLAIMQQGQTLYDITAKVLFGMKTVLEEFQPDIVLVHGDTTTAYAAALAAFYQRIPVGHVEAGLRTNNIYSPYPEEFNRQGIDLLADLYFAPTCKAKENLIAEGKDEKKIYVTGNTGIDALFLTIKEDYQPVCLQGVESARTIVVTAHRRENLGEPMYQIFRAIRRILEEFPDVHAVYPIHMNPVVRKIAREVFEDCKNMHIIEPLMVKDFHNLLNQSYLIMTDSGGIQEEAPALGKPVLVLRDTTERPEGVEAGTLKLIGTKEEDIYLACKKLLTDKEEYESMSQAKNPYGDGTASKQIVEILKDYWG